MAMKRISLLFLALSLLVAGACVSAQEQAQTGLNANLGGNVLPQALLSSRAAARRLHTYGFPAYGYGFPVAYPFGPLYARDTDLPRGFRFGRDTDFPRGFRFGRDTDFPRGFRFGGRDSDFRPFFAGFRG